MDTKKLQPLESKEIEYQDNYKFLTKTSLGILKKHGNLIISLEVFNKGLATACLKSFGQELFSMIKTPENYKKLYAASGKILMTECERLAGFKCHYKTKIPREDWQGITILIEKEGLEDA